MTKKIGFIVGSLRKDSYSKKLANALSEMFPDDCNISFAEIGHLPLYNQDLENDTPPKSWLEFRDFVKSLDAVLFITPEYNRSLPAALKNALDIASRPMKDALWNNKPTAVISTSIGALGGFGANQDLKQVLSFFNMPIMGQPEMYIGSSASLFDENGIILNEGTNQFLKSFVNKYIEWIDKFI